MAFELEQYVGTRTEADGHTDGPVRIARQGAAIVADAHGRYHEACQRGQMFSLLLTATTTGVAAGNILGAAGAAITQFALLNPSTSGKNYSLSKFCMGVISGTPAAGPLFHGYLPNIGTISAGSPGGAVRNNLPNAAASAAIPWSLAAGSALTGGQAPVALRCADMSTTATAQATVGMVKTTDFIDGEIVIPPGFGWVPLWAAAGTTLLNAYSITWEEVPV